MAYHTESSKIIAVGTEAEQIAQKDMGEDVVVMSPLRRGFIADYTVAEKMFEKFMARALGRKPLRRPVVAICVPKGITEVEKKAVEDAREIGISQDRVRELFERAVGSL